MDAPAARDVDPHYAPSFEECVYWARKERDFEDSLAKQDPGGEEGHYGSLLKKLFRRNAAASSDVGSNATPEKEKEAPEKENAEQDINHIEHDNKLSKGAVTVQERQTAYRAFRTAGWVSVFYLITTDILGPYSAPWAFSRLGYVSGCLIFLFLGVVAVYCGFLLWYMYLKLDSSRFPIHTYSDLGLRIYGPIVKHAMNILQSVQLLFNVGIIILGNGQGLSQVAKNKVCFSALCIIWTAIGFIIGQIKTLRNYGWLANSAIWLNILTLLITMGVAAHSSINLDAAIAGALVPANATLSSINPVSTAAFIHIPFTDQVVGVMQIVYSYGGAMLFVEFMAEMRRPWDFWKAMIFSQTFIFFFYMLFGVFVYAFQGQYTINPANQGLSPFGWQTATNIISLVAAIIAAGLYGNIGIKVLYVHVLQELFGFPSLVSKAGRHVWIVAVITYWSLAFVIASAIPQFSNISGIVASICILQFTYSFPPILFIGFHLHTDALRGDHSFDPDAVTSHRVDSWRSLSRWRRALGPRWYVKLFHLILALASLATAGLGAYSSILGIIAGFQDGSHASSFGCQSPVAA